MYPIDSNDLEYANERTLVALPLSHIYTLSAISHYCFYHGVTLVMMETFDFAKVTKFHAMAYSFLYGAGCLPSTHSIYTISRPTRLPIYI